MITNRRTIRVEWGDCDPAGIVYYPRYFEWFDACTSALFEAAGFKKALLMREHLIAFPMVDARSKFILPSRFGDDLIVETSATRFGHSSFDIHHGLLKSETLAVECWETRVWTKLDPADSLGLKSQPIPDSVIRALSRDELV